MPSIHCGRLCRSAAGIGLLLALFLAGCTPIGSGPAEAPAPAPTPAEGAAIEEGAVGAEAEVEATRLLNDAMRLLEEGDAAGALDRAREIQMRYPGATGSARAYLIEARARRALGQWEQGVEAAREFLRLADAGVDPVDQARLVIAELRIDGGLGGGIEALFEISEVAPADVRDPALERGRALARTMDEPLLRQLLNEAPRHRWLLPVFQIELAERRALVGDRERAMELVADAGSLEPATMERDRMAGIEGGAVEPREGMLGTLGVVLSLDGSPTLRGLSEQIRDGIEVALLEDGIRGGIQLALQEDGGVGTASVRAVEALQSDATIGVVGPVTPVGFGESARAESARLPMISPTAPRPQGAREGIYSLTGVDPEASRALARLALSEGYREVAVLHSQAADEQAEMRWFREAFEAEGGRIVQLLSYPVGSTDFRGPIAEVENRLPQALVIFADPDHLSILAAQLVFMGEEIDEEIPVLGSSTWASDRVLASLPVRQTNGILSVAPHPGEGYGPRWEEFVAGYEEHFRRTLRDPVPALGFDAALLLIEGARLGEGTTPGAVLSGMRQIQGFAGATGTFSVRDGRIVRAHYPVRLQNGARIPLNP